MDQSLNRIGLTTRQTVVSALFGAVLWFAAAMLLRALGPNGICDSTGRVWLYIVIVVGTVPFVPMIRLLGGLPHDKIGIAVALATAAAGLLDGVALAWFPWLYGGTPELVAGAGAAILWGAGVAMTLGFVFNRKA